MRFSIVLNPLYNFKFQTYLQRLPRKSVVRICSCVQIFAPRRNEPVVKPAATFKTYRRTSEKHYIYIQRLNKRKQALTISAQFPFPEVPRHILNGKVCRNMALPSEKVQELKQIIHSHLSQMNVHSRIKEYVDESFRGEDPESSGIDEAGLLNALKERGIVDDVMNTLKFEGLDREPRRSKDKRRADAVEEIPTRGKAICFGRLNVIQTVCIHKPAWCFM